MPILRARVREEQFTFLIVQVSHDRADTAQLAVATITIVSALYNPSQRSKNKLNRVFRGWQHNKDITSLTYESQNMWQVFL